MEGLAYLPLPCLVGLSIVYVGHPLLGAPRGVVGTHAVCALSLLSACTLGVAPLATSEALFYYQAIIEQPHLEEL